MNIEICIERCFSKCLKGSTYSLSFLGNEKGDFLGSWCIYNEKEPDSMPFGHCFFRFDKKTVESNRKFLPKNYSRGIFISNFNTITELLYSIDCPKTCPYAVEHTLFDIKRAGVANES